MALTRGANFRLLTGQRRGGSSFVQSMRQIGAAMLLCWALAACSLDALLPATATQTPSATPVPPTATPSNTAAPTKAPTATATFTATDQPTPTATATASPTPTATPTVMGVIRASQRVNVRRGPGTSFAATGSLAPGSEVLVIGRNDEGDWVQIQQEDGDEGWVSAGLLRFEAGAPPFAPATAESLSAETRIVVELGAEAAGALDDGVLVVNLPIADVDAMQKTATVLAGATLTATATAASPTPEEAENRPIAAAPAAAPRYDVKVFAFCNDPAFGIGAPADLTAGSTIKVYWAWFASSEAYLRQHTTNATHELRVNGEIIDNVNLYRLEPTRSGSQHVVYWYVPVGPLETGPQVITYRVTWRNRITDGYASYGPGTDTEFEEESCNFVVR